MANFTMFQTKAKCQNKLALLQNKNFVMQMPSMTRTTRHVSIVDLTGGQETEVVLQRESFSVNTTSEQNVDESAMCESPPKKRPKSTNDVPVVVWSSCAGEVPTFEQENKHVKAKPAYSVVKRSPVSQRPHVVMAPHPGDLQHAWCHWRMF